MIFISSNSFDPYFNLALEEYVMQNKKEEVFMLWQNGPSIIVGKNQNTMAEIDYEYVIKEKIPVVRRLSGGGTVFHDLGNINFTYIVNNGKFGDYLGFTKTLRDYIKTLGVTAEMSGRNDVLIDGRKISGNAQYLWKGRLLHHGTILLNANMERLAKALKPDETKIQSKGIKSVKSRVVNISEFVKIETSDFRRGFEEYIKSQSNVTDYELSEEEIKAVEKLADEKYRTYEWCFGYSPKYTFHKKKRFELGGIEVFMDIVDGVIEDIKVYGDFFSATDIEPLLNAIKGTSHSVTALDTAISGIWTNEFFSGIEKDDFLSCLI